MTTPEGQVCAALQPWLRTYGDARPPGPCHAWRRFDVPASWSRGAVLAWLGPV